MPQTFATARAKARPETIWNACFKNVSEWDKWDPDIKKVENATGCCDEGTTMVFHMNDGGKFDMKCEDVRIHQQLQFSGSFACGCVKAVGRFELCPTGNSRPGHPETEISYTFTLSGLLGGLFGMMVGKDAIVKGTEDGLANVVAMSERAETQ